MTLIKNKSEKITLIKKKGSIHNYNKYPNYCHFNKNMLKYTEY